MLMLVSPAKTLDFTSPLATPVYSQPQFLAESQLLIDGLRQLSPADVSQLMDISDALAVLNVTRFADWQTPFSPDNARQAVLAFAGDVYEGLDAATLGAEAFEFVQQHLRILSGLYGVLRPLDLIQPYRLEMGTRFANVRGKDLYAFWGSRLHTHLLAELQSHSNPTLLNLASEEYFKAVQAKQFKKTAPEIRIIQPVFEDWKNGKYKVISFFAKRARGLMARYVIENLIDTPEQLHAFNSEGYVFDAEASSGDTLMFRRRIAD
jgi:cytoplasmic iron level regulating protein YaaA (DUF328/UPF0246 family)